MKKYIGLLALIAIPCFAQIDPFAQAQLEAIRGGSDSADGIQTLFVKGDGTIGDDLTVRGDLVVSGTVSQVGAASFTGAITTPSVSAGDHTVSTNIDFTVASITVTNGQIITLTSTYTELLNTGTADTTTTNTFAALSAAQVGRLFIIQAAAANTDSIAFAETGILVSGGTLTLGASDGFTAIARATNILRQSTAVMNN